MTSSKSRTSTLLLALFLGCFGAHRFYAGKTGSGVAQLILTLSVVGGIVSGPWVFVDWILIVTGSFKDKDGALIDRW